MSPGDGSLPVSPSLPPGRPQSSSGRHAPGAVCPRPPRRARPCLSSAPPPEEVHGSRWIFYVLSVNANSPGKER